MADSTRTSPRPADVDALERARRDKLRRWREEYGVEPYGRRVDELVSLDEGALQLAIEVAGDAMRGIVDASLKLVPLRIGDLTEPPVLEGRQEHEKNEQRRCEDGRARFRPQHRAGV